MTVVREAHERPGMTDVEMQTRVGRIHADLRIGSNVVNALALRANQNITSPGVKLHGAGFIVTEDEARALGLTPKGELARHIRPYRNGKDLTARPRGVLVIDLFGLSEAEVARRFPPVYQRVLERVKPERDLNNRATYRENWWLFGEPRAQLRPALAHLRRYIATVETAKHRVFQFLDPSVLADNKLVVVAMDDAWALGVLSSRVHVVWALAAGGKLGVGNDPVYVKTTSFEKFPFPDVAEGERDRIRSLGEQLDAHRKRQQQQHSELTITGMYNAHRRLARSRGYFARVCSMKGM